MTYRELSDMMDVLSSRFAASKGVKLEPFDEYEKSVFLTKAANEIVKQMLPLYDRNEKIKKQLLPITRTATVTSVESTGTIPNDKRYKAGTLVYALPQDVMYVVSESLRDSNGVILKRVRPLKDDEAFYTFDSPFRSPSRTYAHRVGLSVYNASTGSINEYSEIISNVSQAPTPQYFIKYLIEVPAFIVTEDLEDATIRGLSSLPAEISLDEEAPLPMLHEKILDQAVLMGYLAKSDDPNSKIAMNNLSTNS